MLKSEDLSLIHGIETSLCVAANLVSIIFLNRNERLRPVNHMSIVREHLIDHLFHLP